MARFEVLIVYLAFAGFVTARFEHLHEGDDVDVEMEIDGVHIDGESRVVAKTCFPVTMEVCLPLTGHNSTHNGTSPWFPQPSAKTCRADSVECPFDTQCYGGTAGMAQLCASTSSDFENYETPQPCTRNCQECTGACTQCSQTICWFKI